VFQLFHLLQVMTNYCKEFIRFLASPTCTLSKILGNAGQGATGAAAVCISELKNRVDVALTVTAKATVVVTDRHPEMRFRLAAFFHPAP
jgi:hypothetical protein